MRAPTDDTDDREAGPQTAEEPPASGTRLVIGLVSAVLIISALGAWAVYADRKARPGTPPQTGQEVGDPGGDGQPTPLPGASVGGSTP